jgi:hypothetical protein
MPYTVALPDGRTVEFPDSVSREDAAAIIRRQFGASSTPQSGFMPALRAGATELGGGISALAGKLGLKDEAKAEAEYQAAKKRAAEIFKPTEEGWTEAPLTKVAELFGGSLPYMAAPLAAGAAAAALPLTGIAGTAAALGAAGLTSAGQFTATNLGRQMEGEEGTMPKKSLGETSLGAAAAAAVPQALLDTAAMRMIPGIGRLFGNAGVKVTATNAKEIAEQALSKTLKDYAFTTGKTAGIEGVTEATQQAFERLQAGLNITDPKAREEYFDSFIGGAVMGGLISPAGRYVERSGEQGKARGLLEEETQKERAAAAKAEAEKRKSPDYILGVAQEYAALDQQKAALLAQIKRGSKEAPLTQEDKDRNAILQQQVTELDGSLKSARKAYLAVGGPDALKKARESTLELTPPEGRVSEPPAATEVPGEEEAPEAKFARAEQESAGLAALLERQREQIAAATTPEEMLTLAQRAQKTEAALADAQKTLAARPKVPNVAAIEKKLTKAREAGDTANVIKYAQQLIAARAAAPAAESGLFAPEAVAAEEARRQELIDEMATGREAAEAARRAAAAEESRRTPTPAQLDLLAEGELERDAVQALAREQAQAMTGRLSEEQNAQLRAAQQTTMFPESQQRVVRTQQEDQRLPQEARNEIAALTRELRKIQRLPDALPGLPTPEIGGPWSPLTAPAAERERVADINRRISDLYKTASPTTVTTETSALPPERAQIDTRPQPKLEQAVTSLLERVGTDPQTDTETQDLAARVQEQLPAVLQQLRIQSQEESQQTQERLAGTTAAGRPVQVSAQLDPLPMVYEWAQSVRSGTPVPDLTRKLTTALQTLEQGQRSETEQVTQFAGRELTPLEQSELVGTSMEGRKGTMTRTPTGDLTRASQMDLEMPEPTATVAASFKDFNDYLASEGLQALRLQKGLVFPTLANLQKRLAPLQTRITALGEQVRTLNERRAALLKASAAERKDAEQLYQEAQAALKQEVETLDDVARTTYVGKGVRQVDLVGLLDQAHARLNAGVAQSNRLREQFEDNLKNLTTAANAAKPVMVDAEGRATTNEAAAVRSVSQGQLPGYQALRKAQLALQEKGFALVAADQKLAQVVQSGIGTSWDTGSPTLKAYLAAKKAKDEAQRVAQQAHYALLQAHKRIPSIGAINNNLSKFLTEKGTLDAELTNAARMLGGLKMGVRNASNRLNAAYTTFENKPAFGFSESLDRLRQDLSAAQNIRGEARGREATAQQEAARLAAEALPLEKPKNLMERQVRTALSEAKQRAEQRRAPPAVAGETQAEREARDGEARKAEQARLERGERPVAGPTTEAAGVYAEKGLGVPQEEGTPTARQQISFEDDARTYAKKDPTYVALYVASMDSKLTSEQRIAASEAAEAYLDARAAEEAEAEAAIPGYVARKDSDIASAKERIAKLKEKLDKVRLSRDEQTKYKDDAAKQQEVLADKREKLTAKIEEEEVILAKHQRLRAKGLGYPKVTRTDPAEVRADRERLLEENRRNAVPGERLGVAEGTRQRGIGPVTRDEVTPPRTLRTGTDESRTGVTTTGTSQPLQEARGVKQRDVAMKPAEMKAANAAAAAMRTVEVVDKERRDLIAKNGAAKERGYKPGEQERFVEQLAILDRRKEALKADETALAEKKQTATASIAANRSRINEINAQLKFIEDNPGQTPDAVNKQRTKSNELKTEREKLASELRDLYTTQTAVEAEAKAETVLQAKTPAKKKPVKAKKPTPPKSKAQALFAEEADTDLDSFEPEILGGDREEVFFSRGATENPSTVAGVRTELSKAFPDLGRVQILDSVEALVAANPQYEGRIPDDARGFVDPDTNKAFLIAENIEQGRALGVLLHEVGAHIGLKNLLGTAQYNALVKAVSAWAKKNDGSIESRVAKAAQGRVEAAQTPANQKDDELLAYAIEEAVNAGVKPMETKGVLGQWLSQIAQMFRKVLQKFGLPPKALDAQGLVDMAFGAAKMEMAGTPTPPPPKQRRPDEAPSEILFSRNVPTAARVANALVGQEKGWLTYLRENFLGMGFRAQFVDKLAPIEDALKRGGVSVTKALQAMYFLRMYDQRMHVTSEAITEGVAEVVEKPRKDGGTERIIQTKPGANIKQVVDILKSKDVIKAAGSADAANNMFTLYLAAIRAERVGYDTLNFGRPWAIAEIKRIETELKSTQLSQETRSNLQKKRASLEKRLNTMPTEADFKAARAEIEADPVLKAAFDKARDVYNQYNRNLLEFSVQTGALSRDVANTLLAQNDYIPYYRMRDGVAQMVIGGETPIRVGNLKDSPHLKELVGGDEAIFDFLTSSVQNTAMLLDMAMKNLATKNAMFELQSVGLATISKVPKGGKTPDGAVTFKRDGEDYFAIVDTDAIGIDSDLLVKGMAGIPTMFPAIVRLMGMPARVLRRAVVASPVYMARQLFRDSLAASMTSGANITPVLGALRQIGKADVLRGRGITGGQVFTGMPEDVTRMLKEMQAGKVGVSSGLAWLEAKSAQADALTRRAQYQSYLDQGLSEMEATFMALESMNFSKRGLSPTMHMASTLIPFFNAQIQGLDVLYKAFTGKMPMNERLAIREKLLVRGSLMFGMSMAYAMAMQDEEEYKNARPEDKYGNWFVRVPGFDEMVRLPIPFELGYVFKALPEALVNTMVNEKGGEEAAKAAKHFATQMVPGLSNYYLPQAVKPGLEVLLNKSIYTGRDIESTQEQMKEPGFRYRDTTTALAREVGELTGFSPIKMEYLIRGYTGGMGMAVLAALSAPFGSDEGPQAATKRLSDMPVIGTLFQPKDASGIIDATFARMKEVKMVKETYDDLIEKGRIADAQKYLSTRTKEMALSSVEGSFREYMGQIAEYERGIKASNMTPAEKRERIDAAKQMKIRLATAVRAVADKKEPQADRV